jgi:pentatricopeptide repeat protein
MMQLHLTTQPSRDLVLHYYNQMVQRGVAPSAHTYKLLLDAFGTLDPIDLPAMERVFANLCAEPNLAVQGTHWTSLIHAYGVIAGDVERAQEIFDSIATHPSLPVHGKIDPICWEAILSVFATHKLVDKMEEYWQKMQAEGIRGTAYINNMLIKGYANVGRIEDARKVFESMGDQVTGMWWSFASRDRYDRMRLTEYTFFTGVAAPNNHPTLLTSSGQAKPTTTANTDLIYREPST